MLEAKEIVLQGWAETPAVRSLTGVFRIKGITVRFEPLALSDVRRVLEHDGSGRGPLLRLDGRIVAGARAIRRDLDELDRLLHDRDSLLGEPHGLTMADLVVAAQLQALDGTAYEESVRSRRSLSRWLRDVRTTWE